MREYTTREMVRPSRARIALARLSALMENTRAVSAVFMVLGIALLGSLAIVTDTTSAPIVFASFGLASSALAVLGASLVADITQATARKQHSETLKRYIAHYSQELERETVARKELQKLLAQIEYDAKNEREYLETLINSYKIDLARVRRTCREELIKCAKQLHTTQVGAHNLAWALCEDEDIRDHTHTILSNLQIGANGKHTFGSAQLFANEINSFADNDEIYSRE